jgi:hypothetical protein
MSEDGVPDEIAGEVYRQPLQRFVEVRGDAVRRLRDAGQPGLASHVAKLRKPSTLLWALNQIGLIAVDDLEALFTEGDVLRSAQQRVVRGDRDAADAMREASRRQRHLADVLARRAGMILTANGHGASDSLMRDLAAALAAAAVAPETVRAALRQGSLRAEPGPAGFPQPDGSERRAAPTPERAAPPEDAVLRAAELERNRCEADAHVARERSNRREAEAEDLEQKARSARQAADRARAEAETAETALQSAIAAVEAARRR